MVEGVAVSETYGVICGPPHLGACRANGFGLLAKQHAKKIEVPSVTLMIY